MKKLFLASLLVVGGLTAYANSAVRYPKVAIESNIQDEFKEIAADALPEAVQAALKKDHPNAVLGKAYVNDKKVYKLEVTIDQSEKVLYSDENGNWIEK